MKDKRLGAGPAEASAPIQSYTGAPPRGWPSAAKVAVGSSCSLASRVWFTVVDGHISEMFYLRPDIVALREMRLIVTDLEGKAGEKESESFRCLRPDSRTPAYTLIRSTSTYELRTEIVTDPCREVVLLRTVFTCASGRKSRFRLHGVCYPYPAKKPDSIRANFIRHASRPVMVACGPDRAIAVSSLPAWKKARIDPARLGDPLLPSKRAKRRQSSGRSVHGEQAVLAFELDLEAHDSFVIAIGFGDTGAAAALQSQAALPQEFDRVAAAYTREWLEWQRSLCPLEENAGDGGFLYRTSTTVLRLHQGKQIPGAVVASLSIPWGPTKRDPDSSAYHLVWTRDLVEIAGALCAMGECTAMEQILQYLAATQHADGHWTQNMRVDGIPHWQGVQLDETALPILLVDLASRWRSLERVELQRYWHMVERAADYLAEHGPETEEDRWEQNSGIVSSTLASIIAGLLAAASLASSLGNLEPAERWKTVAEKWDHSIEEWLYVTGTELAHRHGVKGYYAWLRPIGSGSVPLAECGLQLAHQANGHLRVRASEVVSPDVLALVRFGVRAAKDPRIVGTVKVIDATLRRETPAGPAWRRYTGDAYGETAEGAPFQGKGIGRAWPLLTGERAHYELAAGRPARARELAKALERFSGEAGLPPEQVWDEEPIPSRELWPGRPTGSARPLSWAHAEYIKLLRSLREGCVFDRPFGSRSARGS